MADIREDDGGFGNWFRGGFQKTETKVEREIRLNDLKKENALDLKKESEEKQIPEWLVNVRRNCKGMPVKVNSAGDLYTNDSLTNRTVGIPSSRYQKFLKEGDII